MMSNIKLQVIWEITMCSQTAIKEVISRVLGCLVYCEMWEKQEIASGQAFFLKEEMMCSYVFP